MEDQLKNIIAKYIKIPVEQIDSQTVIDRSAVAGSIIVHRMYAQLATEGFAVEDYAAIKTYGQLLASLNKTGPIAIQPSITAQLTEPNSEYPQAAIGIDIELISAMPQVTDYREAEFYTMNFSPAEISYCILQTDPRSSFAGLFAAKEAIVKADNTYRNYAFNSIPVDHLPSGKPVHAGFQLSISHTAEHAVAVAVKNSTLPATSSLATIPSGNTNSTLVTFIAAAAFVLSLLSLLLLLIKSC